MRASNTNEPESQLESAMEGGYGSPTPDQELADGMDAVENTNDPSGDDVHDEESLDDAAVDDVEEDVALSEIPDDAATNPGSPDPTLAGDESGAAALGDDPSLGAPDKNFFRDEDSGSDGEPGAGRFGGIDDQLQEELSSVDPGAENIDAGATSTEAPSTEAPLTEANTSDSERGPFSSESDADAAGDPI